LRKGKRESYRAFVYLDTSVNTLNHIRKIGEKGKADLYVGRIIKVAHLLITDHEFLLFGRTAAPISVNTKN
jgi:hypothetical protein